MITARFSSEVTHSPYTYPTSTASPSFWAFHCTKCTLFSWLVCLAPFIPSCPTSQFSERPFRRKSRPLPHPFQLRHATVTACCCSCHAPGSATLSCFATCPTSTLRAFCGVFMLGSPCRPTSSSRSAALHSPSFSFCRKYRTSRLSLFPQPSSPPWSLPHV